MTYMTKRGQLDNVVTYEHICDTRADLLDINPEYITLGSIAIVLEGLAGLEVYMATSEKRWKFISGAGGAAFFNGEYEFLTFDLSEEQLTNELVIPWQTSHSTSPSYIYIQRTVDSMDENSEEGFLYSIFTNYFISEESDGTAGIMTTTRVLDENQVKTTVRYTRDQISAIFSNSQLLLSQIPQAKALIPGEYTMYANWQPHIQPQHIII